MKKIVTTMAMLSVLVSGSLFSDAAIEREATITVNIPEGWLGAQPFTVQIIVPAVEEKPVQGLEDIVAALWNEDNMGDWWEGYDDADFLEEDENDVIIEGYNDKSVKEVKQPKKNHTGIVEEKDTVVLTIPADVLCKDNIQFTIDDGKVIIETQERVTNKTCSKGCEQNSSTVRGFMKTFTLPAAVDESKSTLVKDDKNYIITMPKKKAAKRR